MKKSDSIAQLAVALVKFQSQLSGAKKTANNPFFKSKYADLKEIVETILVPLNNSGIAYTQLTTPSENGTITVETALIHESGEWISGELMLPLVKNDPQSAGSAITYARRYALAAICGVYQEDDDAETHRAAPASDPKAKELKDTRELAKKKLLKLMNGNVAGLGDKDAIVCYVGAFLGVHKVDDCTDLARLAALIDDADAKLDGNQIAPTIPQSTSVGELQGLVKYHLDNEITQPTHRKNWITKNLGGAKSVDECSDLALLRAALDDLKARKEASA